MGCEVVAKLLALVRDNAAWNAKDVGPVEDGVSHSGRGLVFDRRQAAEPGEGVRVDEDEFVTPFGDPERAEQVHMDALVRGGARRERPGGHVDGLRGMRAGAASCAGPHMGGDVHVDGGPPHNLPDSFSRAECPAVAGEAGVVGFPENGRTDGGRGDGQETARV